MSLPHAILGALQIMPLTGYELKTQAFDTTIAYFWPVVQQQIYRELDKMLSLGWVKDDLVIQQNRPNRRVYSITEAGQVELAEWLKTPQPAPIYRDALFIQLSFAAQLTDEEIMKLLDDQRHTHHTKLVELEAIGQKMAHGGDYSPSATQITPRTQALMHLVLDFGLRLQKTYIDWLSDAIATIRELDADHSQ